jgi:hypothetical protein
MEIVQVFMQNVDGPISIGGAEIFIPCTICVQEVLQRPPYILSLSVPISQRANRDKDSYTHRGYILLPVQCTCEKKY